MKCVCGGKQAIIETRGNDYTTYRVRHCLVCGKDIVTQETKMDYNEGIKMVRKIFYNKYIKKPPKKKSRSGRRRNSE